MEDVRATILAACRPLPGAVVPLAGALGCVAAEPVVAPVDIPPFDNTAMDGYAVRAADTAGAPVELDVVGLLPAGAAPASPVGPGQAIRIMTGAPMPPGADAVVMVERAEALDGGTRVKVHEAVEVHRNVRFAGSDLRAGSEAVPAGTLLSPAVLGVVASVGRNDVRVHRRPVVGVLSTGDELAHGTAPLRPGQIYDSNRPMLLGLVAEAGCVPTDLGNASDDPEAIAEAISGALGTSGTSGGLRPAGSTGHPACDALLLTGGVSMGDFDFVGDVLAGFGAAREWHIAVKPAKPLAWADAGGRPLFGLPGNPVSAAVSFELFARPALRVLAGHRDPFRPRTWAVATEPFPRRPDGKIHLVRAVATPSDDGRLHVRSAGGQGSHMLAALAAANALALLPDGEGFREGDRVEVMRLGPG